MFGRQMKEAEEAKTFSEGQILVRSLHARAHAHQTHQTFHDLLSLVHTTRVQQAVSSLNLVVAGVGGQTQRDEHGWGHQECDHGGG
jgi:hypothetical protein